MEHLHYIQTILFSQAFRDHEILVKYSIYDKIYLCQVKTKKTISIPRKY